MMENFSMTLEYVLFTMRFLTCYKLFEASNEMKIGDVEGMPTKKEAEAVIEDVKDKFVFDKSKNKYVPR